MKKQKLSLSALKVKSFVTNLGSQKELTVKGGKTNNAQNCHDNSDSPLQCWEEYSDDMRC
ncbi:MAG: pinensin family lanthipeptide [Bacteroidota bacterium]